MIFSLIKNKQNIKMVFIIFVSPFSSSILYLCNFYSIYKFAWYALGYIQYMHKMKT